MSCNRQRLSCIKKKLCGSTFIRKKKKKISNIAVKGRVGRCLGRTGGGWLPKRGKALLGGRKNTGLLILLVGRR